MKLDLKDVTLICVDGLDAGRAIRSIEKCKKYCDYGSIKLLSALETDNYEHHAFIRPIVTLDAYSEFMLEMVHKYVETSHMQTVQHDCWVLNPAAWNNDWFQYDYIGSLFLDEDPVNEYSVGSGGFSFRSRRLIDYVAKHWRDHTSGFRHEDGIIAKGMRENLKAQGFRFAPPEVAAHYSFGGNEQLMDRHSFGFHGFWPIIFDRLDRT